MTMTKAQYLISIVEGTMSMYNKARKDDIQRLKDANKAERERLAAEYGLSDTVPGPDRPTKKEMKDLNRQYRREQQPGFGRQARDYGVWSNTPQRTQG